MLLGKRLAHGIRALYELAILPEHRSAVRDIAQKCGTTEAILRRILLELRSAGYLEAQKGRLGGFRLIKDPQEIKIASVAKIIEREPLLALRGTRRDLMIPAPNCPTHPFWQTLEKEFLRELEQATLADVIALATEARKPQGVQRTRAKPRRATSPSMKKGQAKRRARRPRP